MTSQKGRHFTEQSWSLLKTPIIFLSKLWKRSEDFKIIGWWPVSRNQLTLPSPITKKKGMTWNDRKKVNPMHHLEKNAVSLNCGSHCWKNIQLLTQRTRHSMTTFIAYLCPWAFRPYVQCLAQQDLTKHRGKHGPGCRELICNYITLVTVKMSHIIRWPVTA